MINNLEGMSKGDLIEMVLIQCEVTQAMEKEIEGLKRERNTVLVGAHVIISLIFVFANWIGG
tara:strand:- start:1017 stop:1202 length:186 start_codon:yes stop_codon:yes gene_type:complete